MGLFLRIYKHLLPKARAWRLFFGSFMYKFFAGLSEFPVGIKEAIDLVWLDIFPDTTRELAKWEEQFNLDAKGTTDERRAALLAAWRASGGQGFDYLQQLIWDAGFTDVHIHEWWDAGPAYRTYCLGVDSDCGSSLAECGVVLPGGSLTTKDPNLYLAPQYLSDCGAPDSDCGSSLAECGVVTYETNLLVNKGPTVATDNYQTYCLGVDSDCGSSLAECGVFEDVSFLPIEYPIPSDVDEWRFIVYVGGEIFPNIVDIDVELKDEFERMLLKYFPYQQWLGLLVNYI